MQAVLSQIGSALYATNREGKFLDPDAALSEFFLGNSGLPHVLDQVSRVFDQYYRTRDAITRDPTGSGIGLSIVRELIKKHGGTIHVKPNSPGLTEFLMTIQTSEPKR